MITMITNAWNWIIDTTHFAAAVYQDARAMQHESEEKYGSLGF